MLQWWLHQGLGLRVKLSRLASAISMKALEHMHRTDGMLLMAGM